ncbi:transposase [Actinosynnema sp. ALI-1.44]|uniref:transposase n=1 Tax=Actinosynnema sp. ALI-1.44 TaxID=1933779 RepID=UPI001EDA7171|nr:transposase [Actinosynnema sp. ALI-1.44]
MDFIETVTLTGARQYILAATHHTDRRVRILGTTAHPTHPGDTAHPQPADGSRGRRNLTQVRFLIRDRDAKYPTLINEVLSEAGVTTVLTGVRMPRMNAIMERWVKTLRAELLDRTLIWNETHLRHALREYERHYNQHRTHRSLAAASPLRALLKHLNPTRSNTSPSAGTTVSAESSMSTNTLLNLDGRGFRHAHHHQPKRTQAPRHPTTRSTRWHPPRIPPRRLTSTDEVFGTYTHSSRAHLTRLQNLHVKNPRYVSEISRPTSSASASTCRLRAREGYSATTLCSSS